MPSLGNNRPDRRPTTPEEEGIELHPDAWERFEGAARKFVKGMKDRPAAGQAGADHPKRRRAVGGRAARKNR